MLYKRFGQLINGLRIAGRHLCPIGNLNLIGHEERVQMPRDEAGSGGLLANNVDDILAIKPPALPQKHLLAIVVVIGLILELPIQAAIGPH